MSDEWTIVTRGRAAKQAAPQRAVEIATSNSFEVSHVSLSAIGVSSTHQERLVSISRK